MLVNSEVLVLMQEQLEEPSMEEMVLMVLDKLVHKVATLVLHQATNMEASLRLMVSQEQTNTVTQDNQVLVQMETQASLELRLTLPKTEGSLQINPLVIQTKDSANTSYHYEKPLSWSMSD